MADQLLQEIYVSLFGFSYAFWENEERIWGKKKSSCPCSCSSEGVEQLVSLSLTMLHQLFCPRFATPHYITHQTIESMEK